jgi:hypothetical protein
MTAAEIAATLGGACRSGAWWRCRCPVHGSRGATLALRDANDLIAERLSTPRHSSSDTGETA